jgi:hypothetical protein
MEPASAMGDEETTEDSHSRRDECISAEAEGLRAALRRLGFDLGQAAYITYQVNAETWEQAKAIRIDARRAGWHGSVFVDHACWVVRLVCYAAPAPEFLSHTYRYIDTLARKHGGWARGLCVEDPRRDDGWVDLSAQASRPSDDL